MTIYEKLQTLRVRMLTYQIRKSGRNSFSGYDYFELEDFIPMLMQEMHALQMSSITTFTADTAYLTIYHYDETGSILFTSPMATANVKGAQDIQNLGAVQTYLRRYLWITALEMVEHDIINSQAVTPAKAAVGTFTPPLSLQPSGTNTAPPVPSSKTIAPPVPDVPVVVISPEQQKNLIAVSKKAGWTSAMVKKLFNQLSIKSSATMPVTQYEIVIDTLGNIDAWKFFSENKDQA